jgi:hypothetical protein
MFLFCSSSFWAFYASPLCYPFLSKGEMCSTDYSTSRMPFAKISALSDRVVTENLLCLSGAKK